MALADTARMVASLGFKDDGFSRGLRNAQGQVTRFDTGMKRVAGGAGQIASGLGRAGARIAAGIGLAGAAAAKAAIDWEDAFAGVIKTVDEDKLIAAGSSFDELAESLRAMSREMPISARELAGIAETAGALGIAAGDIEEFTHTVALLATTTNVSADQAATALGGLRNVMGLTGDEFDNFAAALVDLGNKGSSTESQILEVTNRSGAAAKAIGLAKDETLGWAAAAANLNMKQELVGTGLQSFFFKVLNAAEDGGTALKLLAKTSGTTAAGFRKALDKDASGALERFVKGLSDLPAKDRLGVIQDIFGKTSGLNRLVLGLADSYKKNLVPSLETATDAWFKSTAAQEEFEKRNATVKSAFIRLKNGIIDAAVSIGEGFTPALGRAADKLATFLAQDENREALRDLGKDIGAAIDQVNWGEVVETAKGLTAALKPALAIALRVVDALAAMPAEVKGAVLALVGLDKLSGGLIGAGVGNVVGGLAESFAKSMAARIPLFGSAFVQPVFVTNMVPGGVGGGVVPGAPGAKPGMSTAGKLVNGAMKLAILGVIAEFADEADTALAGLAKDLRGQIGVDDFWSSIGIDKLPIPESWPWGAKNTPTILPEVFGGNGLLGGTGTITKNRGTAPRGEQYGPPTPEGGGRTRGGSWADAADDITDEQAETTGEVRIGNAKAGAILSAIQQGSRSTAMGLGLTARSSTLAGFMAASAATAAGARVAGAIAAKDMSPDVTVSTVVNVSPATIQKTYTVVKSYGEPTGSSGGGRNERRPD